MKDGGSAFPTEASGGCGPGFGMTLRDYFAAHAIVGVAMQEDIRRLDIWAKDAYRLADAMLSERGNE